MANCSGVNLVTPASLPDSLPGASPFARLPPIMKKVRLGIIGCGSMSRYHGRVYTTQVQEVEVVALCDTHKENLDRYQREVFDPIKKKPPTYADYKVMLAKVELDAVLIVTPHNQHFEQVNPAPGGGADSLVGKTK